jgi:phage-related protein
MPKVRVVFYKEDDETVPLLEWTGKLNYKARLKCQAKIIRLGEEGHEMRRPAADYLRDGIYELRVGLQGINYRMLYFFHGREAVVVSHGLVKERRVPPKEIDLAIKRKQAFEAAPEEHSIDMEEEL